MEIRSAQNLATNFSNDSNVGPHLSAVSWSAILAGASAAAALSLILLLLGTGLGLTTVSPWAREGISGTTFGVSTIAWITLTSLIASGMGGYIAGRLRARWAAAHADEVYFRDTAHGFLAWAVATLSTAALLTTVISSIVSGAAQTGATFASNTAATAVATTAAANVDTVKADTEKSLPYFLDFLFRQNVNSATGEVAPNTTTPPAISSPADTVNSKVQVTRIYINAIAAGKLPPADVKYAGQLLAQQIGISQQDAENRITDTFNLVQTKLRDAETAARAAADTARKATAYGSLWLFISLLAGAFVASFTAIYGGRQRDL